MYFCVYMYIFIADRQAQPVAEEAGRLCRYGCCLLLFNQIVLIICVYVCVYIYIYREREMCIYICTYIHIFIYVQYTYTDYIYIYICNVLTIADV